MHRQPADYATHLLDMLCNCDRWLSLIRLPLAALYNSTSGSYGIHAQHILHTFTFWRCAHLPRSTISLASSGTERRATSRCASWKRCRSEASPCSVDASVVSAALAAIFVGPAPCRGLDLRLMVTLPTSCLKIISKAWIQSIHPALIQVQGHPTKEGCGQRRDHTCKALPVCCRCDGSLKGLGMRHRAGTGCDDAKALSGHS